jgi:hypothetical protein
MRHGSLTPLRLLWVVSVCLLLASRLAVAAESSLAIDFDGDGRHDHVELDHRQPSVLRIWLSASGTTHVLHSRTPLLEVAAKDLDGDHQPELIARDSESHIHVWKARRRGFHSYRPRQRIPLGLTAPTRRSVDDHNDAPVGVITGGSASPAALAQSSPRAAPVQALTAAVFPDAAAHDTSSAADPFAPRPPPVHFPG